MSLRVRLLLLLPFLFRRTADGCTMAKEVNTPDNILLLPLLLLLRLLMLLLVLNDK